MESSIWNMPYLFDDIMISVAHGQGWIQGEGWRPGPGVYVLPAAIFKNVLDVYNFSIISNLFDSNKPYALKHT